jgi:hypothetical protein
MALIVNWPTTIWKVAMCPDCLGYLLDALIAQI